VTDVEMYRNISSSARHAEQHVGKRLQGSGVRAVTTPWHPTAAVGSKMILTMDLAPLARDLVAMVLGSLVQPECSEGSDQLSEFSTYVQVTLSLATLIYKSCRLRIVINPLRGTLHLLNQ
jgi:hypothetical protein